MSLITLPVKFVPRNCALRLSVNQLAHAAPYGGSEQVIDLLNDRWMLSCELSENIRADAGWREGFVGALRGKVNTVALYHFSRKVPLGTLRGTPVVLSAALQGAASLSLAGTPGATLAAGDMLGASGLLLMVAADCTADATGVITVPLVNRLRKAIAGLTRASTATYFNSAGVQVTAAVNVPRFDYEPVTLAARGLLVEGAATNGVLFSEDFSNAAWTRQSVTVTVNTDVAPDGTLTMDTLTATNAVTSYVYSSLYTPGAGVLVGLSCFLKAGTSTGSTLRVYDGSVGTLIAVIQLTWTSVVLTLAAVSGLTGTPIIVDVGGGVYRVTAVVSSGAFSSVRLLIYPSSAITATSIKAWGAQLELTAPSSYILTTSAPATRAADITVPVTWDKPTAPFRMMANSGVGHMPDMTGALSFDFAEAIA